MADEQTIQIPKLDEAGKIPVPYLPDSVGDVITAIEGAETVNDPILAGLIGDPASQTGVALSAANAQAMSTIGAIPPKPPRGSIISRFQPTHTWTDAAGGWHAYTDIVAQGAQSWGFTAGTGTVARVTRLELSTPVNVVGKSVLLFAYISDPTKVSSFRVTCDSGASGNSNTMQYAPISLRAVDGGKWWAFLFPYATATDQTGTPDRTSMKRFGVLMTTTAPVEVRVNSFELVDATQTVKAGLGKPIIIESDDGDGTNALMHRVLSAYGVPATINMIAENMDRPDRLTYAQLKAWQRNDGWDVQAHAYHLTTQNFLDLTPDQLDTELAKLRTWGRANGFDFDYIAYPQGGFDDTVREIAARYYRGGRTVYATPLTAPGIRPYAIAAFSVQRTTTVLEVTSYIDGAVASGAVPHIVFHHWVEGDTSATDQIAWGTDRLRAVVEHCIAAGYTFSTYSDVYGAS